MINLKTERKPFGAGSRYEYVALYCNDQIENMILDLEPSIAARPYFNGRVKRLFNRMKKEVMSYSIRRRWHTEVSESEFADLMIEMECRYKRHIDILVYSISNSLLKEGVSGDDNNVFSVLLAMGMIGQVGHSTRDNFVKAIRLRYGPFCTSDILDYLYMEKFNYKLVELCNELAKKFMIGEKIYEGKVTEAFNAFIVNVFAEGEFEKVIENAGVAAGDAEAVEA